jgi:hypothetical protein
MVRPTLKKRGLEREERDYLPLSNLLFISKVVERLF